MAGGNSGHSFLRQILARFAVPGRCPPKYWTGRDRFQSTRPGCSQQPDHRISIHPPRRGGTRFRRRSWLRSRYFNPPAPWGAGRSSYLPIHSLSIFQSTRPVGGGTGLVMLCPDPHGISIHPPRGGRDSNHAQNLLCTFLQLAHSRDCAGLAAGHDGRRSAVRTGQHVDFSVRTLRYFSDRFRFAPSDHQNALGLITCLDAKVLHLGLIMVSEVVKPQAVLLRIHQRT